MAAREDDLLLKVRDLDVYYQKLKVLFGVSVEIHAGEKVVIVFQFLERKKKRFSNLYCLFRRNMGLKLIGETQKK